MCIRDRFIVNSHSEVVNGFVNQVREAYQKLNPVSYTHLDVYKRQELMGEGQEQVQGVMEMQ